MVDGGKERPGQKSTGGLGKDDEIVKLVASPEKCCGCRLCETACTFQHEGVYGSRSSRVRVAKLESQGIDYPVVCQRCAQAPCARACPTGALTQIQAGGVIELDADACISCGDCVVACPFGACNLHPQSHLPIICDLCGGEPACARECPTGALATDEAGAGPDYRELGALAQRKRDAYAVRMCRDLLQEWGKR